LGRVEDFMDAVESGLDLEVDRLIDETFLPDDDRDQSRLLCRRRVAERVAHNLWGESAGHRSALRFDPEWKAAVAAFERWEDLLQPPEKQSASPEGMEP